MGHSLEKLDRIMLILSVIRKKKKNHLAVLSVTHNDITFVTVKYYLKYPNRYTM